MLRRLPMLLALVAALAVLVGIGRQGGAPDTGSVPQSTPTPAPAGVVFVDDDPGPIDGPGQLQTRRALSHASSWQIRDAVNQLRH